MPNIIKQIYEALYKLYGPQGWWPLINYKENNPSKIGMSSYHPNNYLLPKTDNQRYEVCIGAILTQNTGWHQVEKALLNLKKIKAINPRVIKDLGNEILKTAIKPAGYFNQKSIKLKKFTDFYLTLNCKTPSRNELLSIWGIGKETADSMLLYAFKVPTFVVDAYTRRIFTNFGLIHSNAEYDEIKAIFEKDIEPNLVIYQEYHALIVEHTKRYYSKKAEVCPIYKNLVKLF